MSSPVVPASPAAVAALNRVFKDHEARLLAFARRRLAKRSLAADAGGVVGAVYREVRRGCDEGTFRPTSDEQTASLLKSRLRSRVVDAMRRRPNETKDPGAIRLSFRPEAEGGRRHE